MKKIIDVKVKTQKINFSKCKADLFVAGHFSDTKGLDKLNAELNRKLGGAIEQVIKLGDFKGKEGSSAVVYSNNGIKAKRVLLVGLGEKKKAMLDTVRKASANALRSTLPIFWVMALMA